MRLKEAGMILSLLLALAAGAVAQTSESAPETVARLRLQLIELQARDEELRARILLLDQEMKPENIASALAGVGSTRPEELREQRRRRLAAEKDAATAMVKILEMTKAGLESAILAAETQAYQQSASPSPTNQLFMARSVSVIPWTILAAGGVVTILLMATGTVMLRKRWGGFLAEIRNPQSEIHLSPSFFMRPRRVDAGRPRISAAPPLPPILPLV